MQKTGERALMEAMVVMARRALAARAAMVGLAPLVLTEHLVLHRVMYV